MQGNRCRRKTTELQINKACSLKVEHKDYIQVNSNNIIGRKSIYLLAVQVTPKNEKWEIGFYNDRSLGKFNLSSFTHEL